MGGCSESPEIDTVEVVRGIGDGDHPRVEVFWDGIADHPAIDSELPNIDS